MFQKSSLLDLIQNYVHIRKEKDDETNIEKENLIFPRYHQLVSINKLKKTIKKESIGKTGQIEYQVDLCESNFGFHPKSRLQKPCLKKETTPRLQLHNQGRT